MAASKFQQTLSGAFLTYLRQNPGIVAFFTILTGILHFLITRPKRARVPVLSSSSGIFSAWKDSIRYVKDSAGVLNDGYWKFSKHGEFFQIPTPARWYTVVPPRYIDEIREAPEEFLSPRAAANDVLQTRYTISPIAEENKFHFGIIKTTLTPNLELKMVDTLDEIGRSFEDEIGSPEDWKAFLMSRAAHRIVTRTANRLLVGAPLCRNEEYLQLSIRYTVDIFGGADKLRAFPEFLKMPATYIFTNVKQQQKLARRFLVPYIKNRLSEEKRHKDAGTSAEWDRIKPQDSLQWVMDAAPNEREKDPERLVHRMLHINVAALHTTSTTFLNCMFDLASHPEIHEELRDDVQNALQEKGWTKQCLNDMRKLDSFMLESQRLSPIASSQMTRGVMRDFTFSNGTTVPAGSFILIPMFAMSLDSDIFPNAKKFDAFRFSKLREQPGEANRHQFVTTSTTHINFGHGKHACPGRFFASNEIKLLLAYTLLHYDVKLGDQKPHPTWYDRSRRPDLSCPVLYRRRVV